jgi:hypothetical protein
MATAPLVCEAIMAGVLVKMLSACSSGLSIHPQEAELRQASRVEVMKALEAAQKEPLPPASELFSDVYDELQPHLREQRDALMEHLAAHPEAAGNVPVH